MKSTKQRNQPKQASSDTKKTLNTQGKAMKSTRLWASWEHLSVLLQLLLFEQYKKNKLTARHHIYRGFFQFFSYTQGAHNTYEARSLKTSEAHLPTLGRVNLDSTLPSAQYLAINAKSGLLLDKNRSVAISGQLSFGLVPDRCR